MGGIDWNEISSKSNGGTEFLCRELEKRIDKELLDNFQIVPSRVLNPLDPTKIRILWAHDLAEDPAAASALDNGGWKRFHRIVCVSNWQMQRFIEKYNIPWERCMVMRNAIVPIPKHEKPEGPIRLVYSSTPQRGLDILYAVFDQIISKHHEDVELDVFSSFKIYGWDETDKQFEPLFERLNEHPRIHYHGAVPNAEVRDALTKAHIFAYPSTWMETSCLCLMEAMSAGLLCVHPNYGALFETAANLTMSYQFSADKNLHANIFASVLDQAINILKTEREATNERLASQSLYSGIFFGWDGRTIEWNAFLKSLLNLPREFEKNEDQIFHYRSA